MNSEKQSISNLSNTELVQLNKPGQYLGGEHNIVQKDLKDVDVRFCLTFPDLYEVGMSHIGIQLLYEIINSKDKFYAERAFMPMADMEDMLREKKQSLCSLETSSPLKDFDFLGFSLQYELCTSNILTMLELSGVPFRSKDRDLSMPLVIGGGPYSYHPEAVSAFFDLFFIGDAEEAISEILSKYSTWKEDHKKELDDDINCPLLKQDLLINLSKIDGIYIPSFYEEKFDPENNSPLGVKPKKLSTLSGDEFSAKEEITRRLLPTMNGAPYIQKPIVPNIETVHNRLSIEVMRGCVRGCRFCQAGYLYRPQRERSPEEVLKIIGESLPETGYEELSLLSLSTADYCSVVPLLKSVMDKYAKDDKLAVSFPSTRVDSLTPEVLEQVQRVRRTGFTVAPEGGTQRIRDVINKGVSDEQILETASNVFKMGWSGIKLYFMLGLPTETDEDLDGIINIASRINKLECAKKKKITVSVSTHVPKPHTPFQWAEQISIEETIRKQRYLNEGLKKVGVNFRYHNPFASFLEGVFCRGDRRLADVIENAYKLGCRLDAWQDNISQEKWLEAFELSGVNPRDYLRERTLEEALPWDHLSCSIPKSYFAKEWKRAIKARETPDCLTASCSVCRACDYDAARNVLWPRPDTPKQVIVEEKDLILENSQNDPSLARFRVSFKKSGRFSLIGHLELSHVIHRSMRRAGIPLSYSRGYHPHPKIIFGPPLQLGIESDSEYMDVYLSAKYEAELLKDFLNEELPDGLEIISAKPIDLKADSLSKEIKASSYQVEWIENPEGVFANKKLKESDDFTNLKNEVLSTEITRAAKKPKKSSKRFSYKKKKKDKIFKVQDEILDFSFDNSRDQNIPSIKFTLKHQFDGASLRASEFIKEISNLELSQYKIKRIDCVSESELK